MDPISLGLLIGGGTGLLKGLVGMDQESKQRKLAAEQWRTSPWTKMQPENVKPANPIGDVVGGLGYGAMIGSMWPGGANPVGNIVPSGQNVLNTGSAQELLQDTPMPVEGFGLVSRPSVSPWSLLSSSKPSPFSLMP